MGSLTGESIGLAAKETSQLQDIARKARGAVNGGYALNERLDSLIQRLSPTPSAVSGESDATAVPPGLSAIESSITEIDTVHNAIGDKIDTLERLVGM